MPESSNVENTPCALVDPMTATKILIAGACFLLVASPLAYFTLASTPPAARPAPAAAPPEGAQPAAPADAGTLRFVLHNAGDDASFSVEVTRGPATVETTTLHAAAGRDVMALWTLPLAQYRVTVTTSALTGATGSNAVDLGACPLHDAKLSADAKVTTTEHSLRMGAPECVQAPVPAARDESAQGKTHVAYNVHTPTLGYGQAESFKFPVHVGAKSMDVVATWTPSTPASERLVIDLYEETGDHFEGVLGASGARTVTLHYENPDPTRFSLGAWPDGEVGATYEQDVAFVVTIHYG